MTDINARAFIVRKRHLVPADVMADDMMGGLKEGAQVLVSVRRPRNVRHHRLLFALLRKVTDNSDRWADEETLLQDLKLATGLFTTRVSAINGMPYPAPASISFAAMDQARFDGWFEKAILVIARDVLNVAVDSLRNEVLAMVDGASRRAA